MRDLPEAGPQGRLTCGPQRSADLYPFWRRPVFRVCGC